MLKIVPEPTFKANVQITVPGQEDTASVELTFNYMPKTKALEFFSEMKGKTDVEALTTLIAGWDGFDVPFSKAALETFLDNYPAAAFEIIQAFNRNLLESRIKN